MKKMRTLERTRKELDDRIHEQTMMGVMDRIFERTLEYKKKEAFKKKIRIHPEKKKKHLTIVK